MLSPFAIDHRIVGIPPYWDIDFGTIGPELPEGMLTAWWAQPEDGSALVACFQRPGGSLSGRKGECDTVITAAPEPTTWALLLTGLAGLALAYRRSKAARSVSPSST